MRVWAGATVTESPVWTPIGSTFSIEQMITTLSLRSRITSSSNSPQPSTDSSTRTWLIGLAARPSETTWRSSVSVSPTPPPWPPIVKAGRTIAGSVILPSASAASTSPRLSTVIDQGIRRPGLVHRLRNSSRSSARRIASLVGADQLDPELLQGAVLVQRHRHVERGLAAERRQQRVGALLLDDLRHRPGQQRLDVGRGGELGVGHDRRRVRVDEDDLVALLEQHLAGLHAGVVELGRLADHDRPGADQEDLLDVVAPRHGRPRSRQLQEAVEEVAGVVRAGAGLGVVLDGRRRRRRAAPGPRPCGRRG